MGPARQRPRGRRNGRIRTLRPAVEPNRAQHQQQHACCESALTRPWRKRAQSSRARSCFRLNGRCVWLCAWGCVPLCVLSVAWVSCAVLPWAWWSARICFASPLCVWLSPGVRLPVLGCRWPGATGRSSPRLGSAAASRTRRTIWRRRWRIGVLWVGLLCALEVLEHGVRGAHEAPAELLDGVAVRDVRDVPARHAFSLPAFLVDVGAEGGERHVERGHRDAVCAP
jgi:hypothetical protein